MPTHKARTLAEQYEQSLHYGRVKHLPAGASRPLPPARWPQGNLEFLERYRARLLGCGVSELVTKLYHVPMARHVFGLTLKHHSQLDLDCALEYVRAKGVEDSWLKNCRLSLVKFRHFLRSARVDDEMRQFLVGAVEQLSNITEGSLEVPVSIIRAINDVERIALIEETAMSTENQAVLRCCVLQIARLAGENG